MIALANGSFFIGKKGNHLPPITKISIAFLLKRKMMSYSMCT